MERYLFLTPPFFFLANSTSSSIADSFVMASPVLYMSLAQKKESLFEAAKSGDSDVNEIQLNFNNYKNI